MSESTKQAPAKVLGYADFDIPIETDPQFWLVRSVHPLTMLLMFALLVLMVLMRMYLITGFAASALIAVGTILAGSIIALKMVVSELVSWFPRALREVYLPGRWRNIVTLVLFVLLWLCPTSRIPERIGFAISRRAMEQLVKSVLDAPPGSELPARRVGLYTARNIIRAQGEVRFDIADVGFGDGVGFVYTSSVLPEKIGRSRYIFMGDKWYFRYRGEP